MQQKIGVQFKIGSKIYSFLSEDIELKIGDDVVVETFLGEGFGKVQKIEEYDPAKENRELKKVLRLATEKDKTQHEKMLDKERLAIKETKDLAEKFKLDMNVVNAEYALDGGKVVIDFIAEDRVDFRDLVKELATKLKSRIELRQIGIRDQAKMVGGIGICGRVCCCAGHLKDFEKVSIKMAKCQGLALNPTKISGSCGRLMCCLAYEDNYYSEVYPKIPKLNREVKTPDGIGVVIYTNALKQIASVKITAKDGSSTIKDYSLDVISTNVPNNNNNQPNKKQTKDEEIETLDDDFETPKSSKNNNQNGQANKNNNQNNNGNNNQGNNTQNNNSQTNSQNNNKKNKQFHKKHKNFNKQQNKNPQNS